MASTTYSMTKAVAIENYEPAFKSDEKKQYWGYEQLITKKPWGDGEGTTKQVFSYTGLPVARTTHEGEQVYYADISELDATTFTLDKLTIGSSLSYEFLHDNKHLPEMMKELGASCGESHARARATIAAQIYNRAFNSSYTMYDGVELCGAHTMNDGTSYTNELTAASLSYDNLWAAINHFDTTLVSHTGEYLTDTAEFLIYHPSKDQEVARIFESTDGEPGTANNDANTIKKLKRIPCRYLTTTTNWFVAGSRWPSSVWWFQREGVKKAMKDDFDRMMVKIRTHQRLSYGVREFLYIVGNQGA